MREWKGIYLSPYSPPSINSQSGFFYPGKLLNKEHLASGVYPNQIRSLSTPKRHAPLCMVTAGHDRANLHV
jgi:hypothetical protein